MLESWINETAGVNISTSTLLVLVALFVIMPLHVWWFKHRERSLIAAWIVAVALFLILLAPVGLGIWAWPRIVAWLPLPSDQQPIAALVAAGLAIILINICWWRFLRHLGRPPSPR